MRAEKIKNESAFGKKAILWLKIAVLVLVGLMPMLNGGSLSAAQLTSRKSTISTSQSGATGVTYKFDFTTASSIDIEGIMLEFCTTPLGTCVLPTGMNVDASNLSVSAQTFSQTGTFAEVSSTAGNCTLTGTNDVRYCANRTQPLSETAAAKSITVAGVTNPGIPSGNFTTVYIRISLYDNSGFSSTGGAGNQIVHSGTVAAAIVRQLTTTGRVQERLEFCVAAIDDDDTLPADCASFPSTTNVDLGVIDNISIVSSPVEPTATNGANDMYGIAMVNTNAAGGTVVTYFPESASSVTSSDTDQLRAFRVLPTDCSSSSASLTDQCFVNAAGVITAGTEAFGLQIPCIDSTQGTTSNFSAANLGNVPAAYSNTDNDWDSATNCEGHTGDTGTPDTGNKFAFDTTGTPQTLATALNVIDDETIKIRFGATASPTTPTGTYTVVTTYVATPTF